ncbi:Organic solute transporter subunit alpha/Transmembrane protein [Phytophthora cactorum]|nr:Organic solute transporter subunit alpha/Transmembrane protein [Phytophthora cactorum]
MAQFWPTDVYLAPPADTLAAPEADVQRLVWAVAGVFVAASVVSSALLIRGHLNHFTQPIVQSKDAALYLDLMRDSYEGYVIYLFLALMIAYLGGGSNERVLTTMRGLPDLEHPWPFNRFLKRLQMATMQFVVVKPMMAFVAIVLRLNGVYDQGNFSAKKGYLYTSLVVNASITYAFYYLVLFYLALNAMRDFNEVMPVVLPTPFKPGAATLKAKKKYDLVHPKDLFVSETVGLLSDDGATSDAESESSLDSRGSRSSRSSNTAISRGWKL